MRRALVLASVALAGCLFPTGGGTNTGLLARNEHKWRSAKIADYDFEYRESCFCPPVLPYPSDPTVRIEVRGGVISRVVSVSTGNPVSLYWTPTIDSLFVRAWRDLSYGYALSFNFDASLGYPKTMAGDVPNAVDDEFTITISNFVRR